MDGGISMTKIQDDDWCLQDNEELDDYIKRIYHLSPDTEILSVDIFLSTLKDKGINFPLDKIPNDAIERYKNDGVSEEHHERLAKDIIAGDVLFSITVRDKNGNVQHLDASMGDEWKMGEELK